MSTTSLTVRRALIAVSSIATLLIGTARAAPAYAASLPKGTVIDASLFGMHVDNVQTGTWPTIPFGALRLWDDQTAWANIETAQSNFNWTNLDNAVATAQAHGMKNILLVLAGTPAWASTTPSDPALPQAGASGFPTSFTWWDEWVTQVVTRYKGKITAYQPWNEANLSTFSTASPQQMATLTKQAYDIIKRIDPAATVVAPSTGTRLTGAFNKFYPAFLNDLGALGWPVDVYSAHTYPAGPGSPLDRAKLAAMWEKALITAHAPAKPLWDTENNFGLAGPGAANPHHDITGAAAQQWIARSYLDALRLGISRVYWYAWSPNTPLLGIQLNETAPATVGYATLERWIVGATFNGCSKGPKVTCNFSRAGSPFQIVYVENGGAKPFKLSAAFAQVCQLDDTCAPLGAKTVTAVGPTYVGPALPAAPVAVANPTPTAG